MTIPLNITRSELQAALMGFCYGFVVTMAPVVAMVRL